MEKIDRGTPSQASQELIRKLKREISDELRPEREKDLDSLIKIGWGAYSARNKQEAEEILEKIRNLLSKLDRKNNPTDAEKNIVTTLERWCESPDD